MKSAAVGWWLGLEWCCGGTVRLVMWCWALWSGEEKVGECYQIDLNHEEQMEILLLIMIWSLIQVSRVRRFLLFDSEVEMVCKK